MFIFDIFCLFLRLAFIPRRGRYLTELLLTTITTTNCTVMLNSSVPQSTVLSDSSLHSVYHRLLYVCGTERAQQLNVASQANK